MTKEIIINRILFSDRKINVEIVVNKPKIIMINRVLNNNLFLILYILLWKNYLFKNTYLVEFILQSIEKFSENHEKYK